jgi:hypothetical protein
MVIRFINCGHLKHRILVANSLKILPMVTDYITQNGLNYMGITSNGDLSGALC